MLGTDGPWRMAAFSKVAGGSSSGLASSAATFPTDSESRALSGESSEGAVGEGEISVQKMGTVSA